VDDSVTASARTPHLARFHAAHAARIYDRYTARNDIRPWTAADLDTAERTAHLDLLLQWADYLNTTYTWTDDHLIPPCWPVHPGLERELTTLYWTYYEAFETEHSTPAAAQIWHDRYLPGFHTRLATWTTPECRQGKHQPRPAADLLHHYTDDPIRDKTHTALSTAANNAHHRPPVPPPPPTPLGGEP
jgi:hypothetical protein